VTRADGDSMRGVTAAGEEITYISPTRLGDCARYIRIISVLDICKKDPSGEMPEEDIAVVAALLCCKPCAGGNGNVGSEFLSGMIGSTMLNKYDTLPVLLALQQSQCLESFILTRALQHRIDKPYLEGSSTPGAPSAQKTSK